MSITVESLKSCISEIVALSKELPLTISHGSKRCKIYEVLEMPAHNDEWMTFNKRFDALFGEDCRDGEGRLTHIRRGEYGMDKVNKYLASVNLSSVPPDLAAIKLDRLKAELQLLSYVFCLLILIH